MKRETVPRKFLSKIATVELSRADQNDTVALEIGVRDELSQSDETKY
jgi:hypothetical protein